MIISFLLPCFVSLSWILFKFVGSHRRTANLLSSPDVIICAAVSVFLAASVCQRVQLQNHSSSIRTNRAYGVAVFDGCPIRYNIANIFFLKMIGAYALNCF